MAWRVEEDAAWMDEGDGNFRHYSGARLLRTGSRWIAIGARGTAYPSRASASFALGLTDRHSSLYDYRDFGTVSHLCSVIGENGVLFAFLSRDGTPFTPLVVSSLKRRFYGHARCVKCKEPMSEFRVAPIRQFDGTKSDTNTYMVCNCGFPVWHMETDVYLGASSSMEECAKAWTRKQHMKAAGGKYTRQEIGAILELQEGRCIYCNAHFTDDLRPTRDHLVPLSYGGTNWALNLVLACRSCNSRRAEIPFRTFCRLLSPRQNELILQHLYRRIRAIDFKNPNGGYKDFEIALRMHAPNDPRYKMILNRYRVNVRKNKLLPLGTVGILKEIGRRQRAEMRRLKRLYPQLKLG